MSDRVEFARMNGLGNKILVVDMRGRTDRVTPAAAVALAAAVPHRAEGRAAAFVAQQGPLTCCVSQLVPHTAHR